jgi:hypothetical protein
MQQIQFLNGIKKVLVDKGEWWAEKGKYYEYFNT